jgi:hypothetical protein
VKMTTDIHQDIRKHTNMGSIVCNPICSWQYDLADIAIIFSCNVNFLNICNTCGLFFFIVYFYATHYINFSDVTVVGVFIILCLGFPF